MSYANTNSDNIIIVKLKTSWSLSFKILPCLKYNVDILLMAATREMCHFRKHFEIISCLHLVLNTFPAMRGENFTDKLDLNFRAFVLDMSPEMKLKEIKTKVKGRVQGSDRSKVYDVIVIDGCDPRDVTM